MATVTQTKNTNGNVSGGKKPNNTNIVSPVAKGEFLTPVETIGNLSNFRVPMTMQLDPFNQRDQRSWFEHLHAEGHNLEFKLNGTLVNDDYQYAGGSLWESWTDKEGKTEKKEYRMDTEDLHLINRLKGLATTYQDLRGKGELNRGIKTGNTSSSTATGNRGRMTDAERAEILKQYEEGTAIEVLAAKYDRSLNAIQGLIEKNKQEKEAMKQGNSGLPQA